MKSFTETRDAIREVLRRHQVGFDDLISFQAACAAYDFSAVAPTDVMGTLYLEEANYEPKLGTPLDVGLGGRFHEDSAIWFPERGPDGRYYRREAKVDERFL